MSSRVFTPISIGPKQIQQRIALAPLTRLRNESGTQVPTYLAPIYYGQRASPGGLLITEATFIAREAGGYSRAPGIYSKEQIEAWKKVTDAVHEKGGLIFSQLWALGRANAGEWGVFVKLVFARGLTCVLYAAPEPYDYMPDVKTVSVRPRLRCGKFVY